MACENIIGVTIFSILLIIPWIVSFRIGDNDISSLINILRLENKIMVPIGILMLIYQIYKSGEYGLSPYTYSYIAIIFIFLNIMYTLLLKFKPRKLHQDKVAFGLCLIMIWSPLVTLVNLIAIVLNYKI
jgi:hypothetical protein